MKLSTDKRFINFFLFVGLLVLGGSAAINYNQNKDLKLANSWVSHTDIVIQSVYDVSNNIPNVDNMLKDYLLNPALYTQLQVNNKIKQLIVTQQQFALLRKLTIDNPIQTQRLDQLAPLINEKINIIKSILPIYSAQGKNAALLAIFSTKSQQLSEEIATIDSGIMQEELRLLEMRTNIARQITFMKNVWLILGSLVASVLFLISYLLLNRLLMDRDRIEQKRQASNLQLKQNQERYELALKGSSTGLWNWNINTNEVFYDTNFSSLLCYKKNEFLDHLDTWKNLLHPADKDRVLQALQNHLTDNIPYNVEYRLKRKPGDYHWYQAIGEAIRDDNGQPTFMSGSLNDITDRVKIEKKLATQYAVTSILSQSMDTIDSLNKVLEVVCTTLDWHVGTAWLIEPSNEYLSCITAWYEPNDNLAEFVNQTKNIKFVRRQGLPGRVWELNKPLWEHDMAEKSHKQRLEVIRKCYLHSAYCFPILIKTELVGVMEFYSHEKIVPDLSVLKMMAALGKQVGQYIEQEKIKKELRDNELYMSGIIESSFDSIITINGERKIVSCNSKSQITFGYLSHELLKMKIDSLIPDVSIEIDKYLNKPIEKQAKKSNGLEFPVEVTIAKMEKFAEASFVIIIRDISERKRIENMKNDFISMVSHELRTPLTSIQGSLTLLTGGAIGELPDKAKQLLEIGKQNSDRLVHLINDILDVQSIESGKFKLVMKPLDIANIINNAITVNQLFSDKYKVKLLYQKPQETYNILGDNDRLLQVLTNLISNAIKFSPANGQVNVVMKRVGSYVRVEVIDKGIGVPEQFQKQIFQKFAQADSSIKRQYGGTGLGLNISKSIIENMGGTIHFTSVKNQGSIFYFDLPILNKENNDITTNYIQPTVLMCEDDNDIAEYIQSLLKYSNVKSIITSNAAETKKVLFEQKIDALILDLLLPDIDGSTLIKEIRANPKIANLPIIVVSIKALEEKEKFNCAAIRIIDWINKPINPKKLLDAIDKIKLDVNKRQLNIIHIEDDVDLLKIVKSVLEDNTNVTSAATLEEAKFKLSANNYDLAILDLMLPDGCSVDLIHELYRKKTPVVVFSSYELPDDYMKFVAKNLIKSKSSTEDLISIIKSAIKENRARS